MNLSDLVEEACLSFESVAFENGIRLDSTVSPDLRVSGDPSSLRRLSTILLDNACKYADGDRRVSVGLHLSGESVLFRVQNSGTPIPPQHLPHLFDRFYRADDARSRQDGGYGLGLSIAKSISEQHKGSICVSSDLSGTCFTVSLPRLP